MNPESHLELSKRNRFCTVALRACRRRDLCVLLMKRSSPPPSTFASSEPTTKKLAMTTPLPASSFLVQRLSDKAKLPTRGSASAAGYDLYRCAPIVYTYV